MRLKRTWPIVALLALLVGLPDVGAAPAEGPEGLLLYASFDNRQGGDTTPRCARRKSRKTAVPGKRGCFPVADYAAGDPLPRNVRLVEYARDGRFGGALRVPRNKGSFSFESDGNLFTQRGTLAFWARPDQPLWSSYYRDGRHPSVVSIRDRQNPLRVAQFMRIGVKSTNQSLYLSSVDSLRDGLGTPWSEQLEGGSRMDWVVRDRWPVATWGHMTVVWDAALGRKWYFNGKPVASNWGRAPEHRPAFLNAIGLGCEMVPNGHGTQAVGFSFDELYVFDYCLTEAQIKQLMRDNRPPSRRNAATPEQVNARRRWVRDHFALDASGIPVCPPEGLTARYTPVKRCGEWVIETRLPMDGKTNTVWPLEYKGLPEDPKRPRELDVDLWPGGAFDFVRLRGSFRGDVRGDGRTLGRFDGKGIVQRLRLPRATPAKRVVFRRAGGRINQMQLFRMGSGAIKRPVLRRVVLAPAVEPKATGGLDVADALDALRAFYPEGERRMLREAPPGGGASPLRAPAYRAFHIVTEPVDRDTVLGGLALTLNVRDLALPATLTVIAWEPLTHARQVLEFTTRVARPCPDGIRLSFDGPAILLDKGKRLWLTLYADQALEIAAGSTLTLYAEGPTQRREAITSLRGVLCDQFVRSSEPQPWNAGPGLDPFKQFKGTADIVMPARQMLRYDPKNRAAASILSWIARFGRYWAPEVRKRFVDPYADLKVPDLAGEGPEWARTLRAAHRELRACVQYWVDRQTPEGLLGSSPNDDTDLIPDVVNFALIYDPDGRMRDSVRKLADYCWTHMLTRGISTRLTDHLHSFEDGTNLQPPLALLYYGDPEYVERLMVTTRTLRDHVTGVNPQGDRLFRSHFFSATKVREDVGFDSGWCLVFSPPRYLGWYNGSPLAVGLLRDWQRSFFRRIAPEYGPYLYGKGGMRSIDFKTGRMVPGGPSAMGANLYAIYDITGDRTLLEPLLAFWRKGKQQRVVAMAAWKKWRKVIEDPGVEKGVRSYVKRRARLFPEFAWQLGLGKRERVVEALKQDVLYVAKYRPLLTWVGQSADRVRIPQNRMATMMLGGMADKAKRLNYHYHAVSWEGADGDVARWVIHDTRKGLKVLIYNFHRTAQPITMRVWRLGEGTYRMVSGVDTNGDDTPDAGVTRRQVELARYSPVKFTAPPGKTFVVALEQIKAGESIRRRPDLALGPTDTGWRKGGLRVTVHNIGGSAACGGQVEVIRAGRVIARKPFPPLPAPDDLTPVRSAVVFDGLSPAADVRVRLAPAKPQPEITLVNNELNIKRP